MKDTRHTNNPTWFLMMGMLGGRLLAISVFLVILSFVLAHDGIAFYAFIGLSYVVTIPYSLWMRNQDSMRRLAPLQFLVDLVFVSGLVYFAGGRGHDFLVLLYPLIILAAGIILPPKQTIQITALTIISYTLIVLLISQNILVAYAGGANVTPLVTTSQSILFRTILFIFFGIASAQISRRCDYINRKEAQFRETTKLIVKNVKTGLLLLDQNNTIIMANDRASILLGRDPTELAGKNFSSIHLKPSDIDNADLQLRGASDYFRRSDGSVFPVSIKDARLHLPADTISSPSGPMTSTHIINFNDLSNFLSLQSQTRQLERVKAAANMAREMAHQIRTPLTGISGAVQILQINLKIDNPKSSQERENLCGQIVSETEQMDKIIQNFLDYAEFSPDETRNLFHMDI